MTTPASGAAASPAPVVAPPRFTAGQDIAAENYLKTIYAHTEWQPDAITPSVLAARLGIAPSSVTEMVKKLAAAGLITHVPYGPLTLTEAGRLRATGVVRRHRLIETWLVREMGYGWHEVHDEAEVLEHSISDRLLDAIDERLGRPVQDPHGDPIPTAAGVAPAIAAVLLAEAPVGHSGVVVRISDRDPSLLETLAASGIGPGTAVRVAAGPALQLGPGTATGSPAPAGGVQFAPAGTPAGVLITAADGDPAPASAPAGGTPAGVLITAADADSIWLTA